MRLIVRLSSLIVLSSLATSCGELRHSDETPTTSNGDVNATDDLPVALIVASSLDQGSPALAQQPVRTFAMQWDDAKSHALAEGVLINANLNADPVIKTYRLTELKVTETNCETPNKAQARAFLEAQKPKSSSPDMTKPLTLGESQGVDEKSYQYNLSIRISNTGNCESIAVQGSLAYEDGSIIN